MTCCYSSRAQSFASDVLAYKVAHLEVAKKPRVKHASQAIRAAQAAAENILKANGKHEWQAVQAIIYAKMCDNSVVVVGKELRGGLVGNMQSDKVLEMIEHPKYSSTTHELSEEFDVINERAFTNTASKTPFFFKNPISQHKFSALPQHHQTVYSFMFTRFRREKQVTDRQVQAVSKQQPCESNATSSETPAPEMPAPKKPRRQRFANLQLEDQPTLEELAIHSRTGSYWAVTHRYLSELQTTYVMYDRQKAAHVVNFFQYEPTDVVRATCTCDLFRHLRMQQTNPSVSGAVSSVLTKCTHVELLLDQASQALCSAREGTVGAVLDQTIYAHSDRLWSILENNRVYLVEKSRKSYVCRSCTHCTHGQQLISAADQGHVQPGKQEMEACPWLTCEAGTPKCVDCFSNYCPSTRLLVSDVDVERELVADAITQTMKWAVLNTDGAKAVLSGKACKPCFCETHSAVSTVSINAFIISFNDISLVELEHQVCAHFCHKTSNNATIDLR